MSKSLLSNVSPPFTEGITGKSRLIPSFYLLFRTKKPTNISIATKAATSSSNMASLRSLLWGNVQVEAYFGAIKRQVILVFGKT
jgi:hypothetical protein